MSQVDVEAIPCLKDNYAYLITLGPEAAGGDCYVVDPSEAAPVVAAMERRRLTLRGILATHHHSDHVGGIRDLLARAPVAGVFVAGHALDRDRIPGQTVFVEAGTGRFAPSGLTVFGRSLLAMHIPGHTRAAIAWGIPASDDASGAAITDAFTGDTLFGAGCGRLFEGTPAQMFASLRSLTALPDGARLWFGHEYTDSNLRFAATLEPDSAAISQRRARLTPRTTPTTVSLERETNPFVRASSVEELAARRTAKDSF